MRQLTEGERARLAQLKGGLDDFVREAFDALGDFMDRIGLPDPYMVLENANYYLSPLDLWMKDQIITPEDRIWILTRIGYFIGELLNQRLGGYWFLDEHPDSPYFLQYVVGQFTGLPSLNVRISPFALAANYVDLPPGRSLIAVTSHAEGQLRQCSS